jgi:heavy metal translocating P-type ATPase
VSLRLSQGLSKPEQDAHTLSIPLATRLNLSVHNPDILRIAFVALACLLSLSGVAAPLGKFDYVAAIAALVGGLPIYREAWHALIQKRMTMELSMTIALLAALLIGENLTASLIVLFVLIAEMLEESTMERGARSMEDLISLMPRRAFVERAGELYEVPISEVQAGMIVVVKPGSRIPVDGQVVSGCSFIDESTITGESIPVEKYAGAAVYAGTINHNGALYVRAAAVAGETAFGRVLEIVEQAQFTSAPVQKTADKLAGHLVFFSVCAAVATFLITHDLRSTISVIIVAGACGVAAGTPLAVLGAMGRAARTGAIFKGGIYLEKLSKVNLVLFDKTGTLTHGRPTVCEIVPFAEFSTEKLLYFAASAEHFSQHPLAEAIREKALDWKIDCLQPEQFESLPGMGLCCFVGGHEVLVGTRALLKANNVPCFEALESTERIATAVFVAIDRRLAGTILISDSVRLEAAKSIQGLRELGIESIILTGDSVGVAQAVALEAGIHQVHAGLLPDEKACIVARLQSSGATVAMLGDGVNDAPALALADVGVAIGSGVELAHAAADVLLISSNLESFVSAVRIAKSWRRVVYTNFYGTIAVDIVGIILAALGLVNPLMAALIHVGSELLFISNSARLLALRLVPKGTV